MFCPLQARYALAKYNLLHTDWQNTTGKILISKTLQAKYFMGKILIGNILVGKVLGGNKRWAKYFVGNATGRQSTIDQIFFRVSIGCTKILGSSFAEL